MTAASSFEIVSIEAGHGVVNSHEKVATWQGTAIVLIAEVIGVGVLGLPYVFLKCGWVVGFLALSLLCLTNMYSGFLLHRLFLQFPTVTRFADFGKLIGPWTERISSGVATTMAMGMATLDFLIAAQSLQAVVKAATSHHFPLVYSSLIVLGVMLPVVQIRSLHGLVWLTAAGVATIALPLVIVLAKLCATYGLSDTTEVWPPVSENTLARRVAPIFTIVFGYFGSVVQVQLQSEMKRPQDYAKVIKITSVAFFVIYAGACAIGYGLMGDATCHKLTDQLAGADETVLRAVVNGLLFIHASVALAINACVTNKVFAETVAACLKPRSSSDSDRPAAIDTTERSSSKVSQEPAESFVVLGIATTTAGETSSKGSEEAATSPAVSRSLWFGASASMLLLYFVIASSLTSFSGLLDVLSASAGMTMLYVLPSIFALRLLEGVSTAERWVLRVTLAVAVVFACIATYATIVVLTEDMAKSQEHPPAL